jgi:hypothetical protein
MASKDPGSSRFSGEEHHGWAPDVGTGGEEAQEARRKAMDEPPGDQGEGREVTDTERAGVSSTDAEPGSPHGAGESETARPEEEARGEGTKGHKGPSGRPYGRTDDEDTGVGKEDTATEGPDLPTGG